MGVRYGSTVWEFGMGVRYNALVLWGQPLNGYLVRFQGSTVMGSTVFGMDYCMDGLKGMGMDCFVVKIIMKRNIKKYKKRIGWVCIGMYGYGWVWMGMDGYGDVYGLV